MISTTIVPHIELITVYNRNVIIERPVNFSSVNNAMLIKSEYKKSIKRNNPITYFWIIYTYAEILYFHTFKNTKYTIDDLNRFCYAYTFEYLKIKKCNNFYEIVKNNPYLNIIDNCKYYFDNSNFIINSVDIK